MMRIVGAAAVRDGRRSDGRYGAAGRRGSPLRIPIQLRGATVDGRPRRPSSRRLRRRRGTVPPPRGMLVHKRAHLLRVDQRRRDGLRADICIRSRGLDADDDLRVAGPRSLRRARQLLRHAAWRPDHVRGRRRRTVPASAHAVRRDLRSRAEPAKHDRVRRRVLQPRRAHALRQPVRAVDGADDTTVSRALHADSRRSGALRTGAQRSRSGGRGDRVRSKEERTAYNSPTSQLPTPKGAGPWELGIGNWELL